MDQEYGYRISGVNLISTPKNLGFLENVIKEVDNLPNFLTDNFPNLQLRQQRRQDYSPTDNLPKKKKILI